MDRKCQCVLYLKCNSEKCVSDYLRGDDGYLDCWPDDLLLVLSIELVMDLCTHHVLWMQRDHTKYFLTQVSRGIPVGLPRVPISHSAIRENKWLLLLGTCGRSSHRNSGVLNEWAAWDGGLWICDCSDAGVAHDSFERTLHDWYDQWTGVRSLLLHDCDQVPPFVWSWALQTKEKDRTRDRTLKGISGSRLIEGIVWPWEWRSECYRQVLRKRISFSHSSEAFRSAEAKNREGGIEPAGKCDYQIKPLISNL